MEGGKKSAEEFSLKELMLQLPIAKLWTVIAVSATLIAGSFMLGFQTESYLLEKRIDDYKLTIKNYQGLETKERFLSLYLSYLIAKDQYNAEASEGNLAEVEDSGKALNSYMTRLINIREDLPAEEIEIRGILIGKSASSKETPTVKFLYDGTIWPIPKEFQVRYLDR